MARARPSQAAVKNVIEALMAYGVAPATLRVEVRADGGFSIEPTEKAMAESPDRRQAEPRRWGQRG
ncbi:MAG TPA: hypothetical protein DD444_05880 [Citreicella sp.]|jgi:hypothetical protein|nr:hypothetical protein [Citreicella sp.]